MARVPRTERRPWKHYGLYGSYSVEDRGKDNETWSGHVNTADGAIRVYAYKDCTRNRSLEAQVGHALGATEYNDWIVNANFTIHGRCHCADWKYKDRRPTETGITRIVAKWYREVIAREQGNKKSANRKA